MNEINVVIGGFSGEDLKWLAPATVRLQVSDYSQLFDYNFPDKLEQNTPVYAPIIFEENVIVMISADILERLSW